MDYDKTKVFTAATSIVREVLLCAAKEIANELESRDEFKTDSGKQRFTIKRGNRGKVSQGVDSTSTRNEFSNYIWITITDCNDKNKQWIITMHYNDIDGVPGKKSANDKNSGNTHSQFGRLQFWKDMTINKGVCDSPNEILYSENGDIVLKFCASKAFDPKQSIGAGTYDPQKLVDSFLKDFVQCC